MLSLLNATKEYISLFKGIRLSTRPDCISEEILSLLKSYNVTSIELGAQSMDNDVLKANRRGHTAEDVYISSKLIKNYGFSLGLQMMTGLFQSNFQKDINTADEFIKIHPDTVRIYPTVILDNTYLGELYKNNCYFSYTLDESVNLCSKLIVMFENAGINIIRLGLHYSESLNNNILYNNYHPAFKELCENKIFKNEIKDKLKDIKNKDITIFVNPNSKSKLIGQKKSNIKYLISLGYNVTIYDNIHLGKYEIIMK